MMVVTPETVGTDTHATVDLRCLFCLVLAALPWPDDEAGKGKQQQHLRLCPTHLRVFRQLQCLGWNQDRAHQQQAGRATAAQMTHEERVAYGHAAFLAFMVRFRAQIGQAPLPIPGVQEAVAKYLVSSDIRACGFPLTSTLAEEIYQTWCQGKLLNVEVWLSEKVPPHPDGLWANALSEEMVIRREEVKNFPVS